MKKYLLATLVTLFCLFDTEAQTIDWTGLSLTNNPRVSGKVNGFNMGGYAYGRINTQSSNITVPSECSQCGTTLPLMSGAAYSSMQTKPNVIQETAKLNPGVLRFPGGTHSGWYHLYEYDNQGFYDAASPKIDKGYGMTAIEAGHLNNPLSYCRLDSRITVNQNFLDGFMNYVKNIQNATGNPHKIEITYVANLLTHFRFLASQTIFTNCGREKAITPMNNYDCSSSFSYSYTGNEALFNNDPDIYRFELYYKETQDAIDKIVSELALSAQDVLYVEMGNEYYSSSGYPYAKYQMDIDDYTALVEIYAERLKCYFSQKVDIKIGAVTKPSTAWQTKMADNLQDDVNSDGRMLNEVLDAVIYHDYYTSSVCLDETDIDTRFNCAKEAFRDHIEIDLPTNLDILQNDFSDQHIWITEWNMLKGTDDKNLSYLNTILHASFVQEYALGILNYNAAHNNPVAMLAHHRLGDHNVWSVIQTRDGNNSEAHFRSGAYAMQYMSKLYDYDNMYATGNLLMNGTTMYDTKEAIVAGFVQGKDGNNAQDRLLLFFSNKTSSDIPFSIPTQIDQVNVDSVKVSFLTGDYLFTYGPRNITSGKNRFLETGNTVHNNDDLDNLGYGAIDDQFRSSLDSTLSLSASHIIPANAIGILELYLEDIALDITSEEQVGLQVDLYPNPAAESVQLSVEVIHPGIYSVELSSSVGRRILALKPHMNRGANTLHIDTDLLENGVYILTIQGASGSISKKVVIQ